jgi:transcriptional regulator with XRE-family HTH domain
MDTVADRLRLALVAKGDREGVPAEQKDLARACGVTQAAVSLWMSSKTRDLRSEHLFNAADWLGVSPRWLGTGKGSMIERKAPLPDDETVSLKGLDGAKRACVKSIVAALS